ncbi:MAG: hypothetical protein ACR2JC_16040 [Chloroflexota bacterium]
MKIRNLVGMSALACAMACGAGAVAAPAFASSPHQGNCNAYTGANCNTPTKVTTGGTVTGVAPAGGQTPATSSGGTHNAGGAPTSVQALPRTGGGGGVPASPDNSLLPLLAVAGLSVLGWGARRRFK